MQPAGRPRQHTPQSQGDHRRPKNRDGKQGTTAVSAPKAPRPRQMMVKRRFVRMMSDLGICVCLHTWQRAPYIESETGFGGCIEQDALQDLNRV